MTIFREPTKLVAQYHSPAIHNLMQALRHSDITAVAAAAHSSEPAVVFAVFAGMLFALGAGRIIRRPPSNRENGKKAKDEDEPTA